MKYMLPLSSTNLIPVHMMNPFLEFAQQVHDTTVLKVGIGCWG